MQLYEESLSNAALIGTIVGVQGFVREASRTIVIEGKTPAELLDKLAAYKRELFAPVVCLTSAPVVCLTYISDVPLVKQDYILDAQNGICETSAELLSQTFYI